MTLIEDAYETLAWAIALRIILDTDDDNAMGVWSRQTTARFDLGSTDRVYELLAEMAGGVEIPDDEGAGFRLGYAVGRRLAAKEARDGGTLSSSSSTR
jgi:hypothetical protein